MTVGGDAPVVVQSMTNTDTADIERTAEQVAQLTRAGSELVRITVDRDEAAAAVPHIRDRLAAMGVGVPLVGDFHYIGHKLLTDHPACAEALDKYRINPGNVGFRAKRHSGVIDLDRIGHYDPRDFWEALDARHGRVVLDPGQFYIFASKENVVIPADEAAEMAPIRPELGEFRAHYAGFFDPGFGITPHEGRAVLEVRSRDVPFIVEDGQPVGKLVFEPLSAPVERLYGEAGSSYQGQGLKLSKHFARWR